MCHIVIAPPNLLVAGAHHEDGMMPADRQFDVGARQGEAMRETVTAWVGGREGALRFLPLLAGLLGALAAAVGAAVQGFGFPTSVVAVFVVIGLAATWQSRERPWLGAIFVAALASVVVGVVYG